MTRRKKQVSALRGTAVAWDQASEERFSEITSGTSRWQQGLIASCKDSSGDGTRLPDGGNADIGQRDSGYLAVPSSAWRSDTEPS